MEREILYRGKTTKNKEWIFGYYLEFELCDGEGRCSYIKEDGYQPTKVIHQTVGQFVGMPDKNGKQIFEGDIVRHTRKTKNGIESTNNEVYFDSELLEFGLRQSNECFHCQFNDEFEVIGNIYDTPELLNQK